MNFFSDSLKEDRALKHYANETDSPFNWQANLEAQTNHLEEKLDLKETAQIIGKALVDLKRAQECEEIFTPQNQALVAQLTQAVAQEVAKKNKNEILSTKAMHLLIEKTLIDKNAHDLARSLVHQRINTTKDISDEKITTRVIRRNGKIVPWNSNKIEIAVRKSFLAQQLDSSPALEITKVVGHRVLKSSEKIIHIETLQDWVQEALMNAKHYKVAEAYILYRAERTHLRDSQATEIDEEAQESLVIVKTKDDSTWFWNPEELRKRIEFASLDLDLSLSKEAVEKELRRSIYSEISQEDLKQTIILNAKSLMERDADFAKFAGRILLSYIYEEVLEWNILEENLGTLSKRYRHYFKKNLHRAVEIERINPRLLEYDLDKLAKALDPWSDLQFDYLSISTLYDRYLIIDKLVKPHRRLEIPQFFWMRVSMGLFLNQKENREDRIIELYQLYKSRRFCSSTPTLFNSGTSRSQLSSCYLYSISDSLESIMTRGIAENAYLSKWAGGLGGSWTNIRGTGSHIQGTNGESQGIIPFLKLHNDQLVAVNQGGKRRGSGCAYLETWHNDILDFLELRRNTGDDRRRTHDMNTANWIPDLFMKRMETRKDWTLFRSNEVPDLHNLYGKAFESKYVQYEVKAKKGEIWSKVLPAIDIWKSMLKMLFETGHPWITFKDPCNIRSPQDHVGVIHSSNLCTEITLNTSEEETAVCNLGSIVLESHLKKDGSLDLELLRETIRIAIRALDNVIDLNFYPTEAAKLSNQRNRPIGLGVMGLQNALFIKNIPFNSKAALEFNDEFMEAISYLAYEASSDLAKELGHYPTFKGSKWDKGLLPLDTLDILEEERGQTIEVPKKQRLDWDRLREKIKKQGMRNSNVVAIAPTATISNIMCSSPCIEPSYKNFYVKSNLSGNFIVLNAYLVKDLKSLKLWDDDMIDQIKYFDGELENIERIPESLKQKYLTAFGIDYKWFLDAAARRQKWIDQSQSVNLFLKKPDLKTLSHMYRSAWRKGLKTTYYLRTLGASNIEKATVNVKKEIRGIIAETNLKSSPEDIQACRLDAMINEEECEVCQ